MEHFVDYNQLLKRMGKAGEKVNRRLNTERRKRNIASFVNYLSGIVASRSDDNLLFLTAATRLTDYSGKAAKAALFGKKK